MILIKETFVEKYKVIVITVKMSKIRGEYSFWCVSERERKSVLIKGMERAILP